MASNESFRNPDQVERKTNESPSLSVSHVDYIETSAQVDSLAQSQAQTTNQLLDGNNPFQIVDEDEDPIVHSDVYTALEMFDELDRDGDRFVTQEEILETLRNNPDLDEKTAQTLGTLAATVDELEEFSNDEFGDENDGLSAADINLQDKRLTAIAYVEQNIYEIDANADGAFSREELVARLADDPKGAPYLSTLIDQFEEIEDLSFYDLDSGDGLSNQNFTSVTMPVTGHYFPGPAEFRMPDKTSGPIGTFARSVASQFRSLDDDRNGFISAEEAAAEGSTSLSEVPGMLFRNGDTLSQLSDDEIGEENDGVTRRDIQVYEEQSHKLQVYSQFHVYDLNSDGMLAENEIKKVLERNSLTGREREALEYVNDNFRRISNSNQSLKRSQLNNFESFRMVLDLDEELEQ